MSSNKAEEPDRQNMMTHRCNGRIDLQVPKNEIYLFNEISSINFGDFSRHFNLLNDANG